MLPLRFFKETALQQIPNARGASASTPGPIVPGLVAAQAQLHAHMRSPSPNLARSQSAAVFKAGASPVDVQPFPPTTVVQGPTQSQSAPRAFTSSCASPRAQAVPQGCGAPLLGRSASGSITPGRTAAGSVHVHLSRATTPGAVRSTRCSPTVATLHGTSGSCSRSSTPLAQRASNCHAVMEAPRGTASSLTRSRPLSQGAAAAPSTAMAPSTHTLQQPSSRQESCATSRDILHYIIRHGKEKKISL